MKAEEDIDVDVESTEILIPRKDPLESVDVNYDEESGEIDVEENDEDKVDPFMVRKEELKEMRNQLLSLKKELKSVDKKSKKVLQERISALEEDIERRRNSLETDQKQVAQVPTKSKEQEKITQLKAKKQAKKIAEAEREKQRQKEAEEMAALIPQLGRLEQEAFAPLLLRENLAVHAIAPDGNCLFNALVHQLQIRHQRSHSQDELREVAADYILANASRYEGFLEEPLEEYCERIREAKLWGGHLELDALSAVLALPIVIYQSDAEPLKFGEQHPGQPLRICFQKFAYTLGEHYDSLIDRVNTRETEGEAADDAEDEEISLSDF